MFKQTFMALTVAATMATVGSPAQAVDMHGYTPPNNMAAAGVQIFRRCMECHSFDPSKNTFGPNLRGVYMRKAASLPRYQYSKSLSESGLTWDEDNLRAWIAGNTFVVEGTRMRHISITDQAEQDYLIAFLKTFK